MCMFLLTLRNRPCFIKYFLNSATMCMHCEDLRTAIPLSWSSGARLDTAACGVPAFSAEAQQLLLLHTDTCLRHAL